MIKRKKTADEWGVWFLLNLSDAWVGGGCIKTHRAAISIAAPAQVISIAAPAPVISLAAPANYFSSWFNAQQDAGPSPSAGARPGSISGPPAPSGLSHDPPGHLGDCQVSLGELKEMTWIQLELELDDNSGTNTHFTGVQCNPGSLTKSPSNILDGFNLNKI